jgi:hypothetical protein
VVEVELQEPHQAGLPCACRTRELNCSYDVLAASSPNNSPMSGWLMPPKMPPSTLENGRRPAEDMAAHHDLEYVFRRQGSFLSLLVTPANGQAGRFRFR